MKDRREFAFIDVNMPGNPKLAGTRPATKWLAACAILYAARHLTDGHVPPDVILHEAGCTRPHLTALIDRGVLHPEGHDCPRCPQPKPGQLYVHDYLEHQRSRAQADAQRAAGQAGARARWHTDRDEPATDSARKTQEIFTDSTTVPARKTTGKPTVSAGQGVPGRCGPHANRNANRNAEVEVEVEQQQEHPLVRPSTVVRASSADAPPVPSRPLPDDWQPNEEHQLQAARYGLDLETEAFTFRQHALAHDRRLARPNAAFAQWLANGRQRTTGRANGAKPSTTDLRVAQGLAIVTELRALENQQPRGIE